LIQTGIIALDRYELVKTEKGVAGMVRRENDY